MPFYNGTLFQINEKEMLRYAGMNPSSKDFPPEEVSSAVREALALAEPRGIWQVLPYDNKNGIICGDFPMKLSLIHI